MAVAVELFSGGFRLAARSGELVSRTRRAAHEICHWLLVFSAVLTRSFCLQSFVLEFHFEPNDYFTNSVLTKTYKMKSEPDKADPFSFEGPEIVDCDG